MLTSPAPCAAPTKRPTRAPTKSNCSNRALRLRWAGGEHGTVHAAFGAQMLHPGAVNATRIVLATPEDACAGLTNTSAAFYKGRVVLVQRGKCTFVAKVKNAQTAGEERPLARAQSRAVTHTPRPRPPRPRPGRRQDQVLVLTAPWHCAPPRMQARWRWSFSTAAPWGSAACLVKTAASTRPPCSSPRPRARR